MNPDRNDPHGGLAKIRNPARIARAHLGTMIVRAWNCSVILPGGVGDRASVLDCGSPLPPFGGRPELPLTNRFSDVLIRRFALIAKFIAIIGGFWTISIHAGQYINREPNTSLRFPTEQPVSDFQFVLSDGIGEINFDKPVALATPPGETNRIFVVESAGRIIAVTNLSSANPTTNLFLDISDRVASDYDEKKVEGLTSLAFHPGYQTNGLFYVTYTTVTTTTAGFGNHNRLSEFRCSPDDPTVAMPDSEVPFITQIDHGDGHNFNDVHFGPDGYLYASLGDEGDAGMGDDYNNAQRIDKNFFSGIIRIDPDKRPGNLPPNPHEASSGNYAIPFDNPFVGATSFNGKPVDPTQVRTEFFAVGLRNPWRFSFDPLTGEIYEGDVGEHAREEINLIVKGGNYGWSFLEGTLAGPKGPVPAGVSVINPLYEYSISSIECVIGGVVYRGSRFPNLYGAYIFGDYQTGDIWALRNDSQTGVSVQRLLTSNETAGFGVDPANGDVLIINHSGGRIWRLAYRATGNGQIYPPTLADTGVFSDLTTLTPNPGIVPYDVNVPLWSDGALKRRWFSVTNLEQKITFQPESNWSFPSGAVWIKHFELELTPGDPSTAHRVETRALIKTSTGVYGVTYRWGDSTSNAVLVADGGMDEAFAIQTRGTIRTQVWHYPSRSECLTCHTPVAGYVLGFNTPQLNCEFNYPAGTTNQIAALSEAGYFSAPVTNVHSLRALAKLQDETSSREYRVRSYLFANCAQCHQPDGPAHVSWDARMTTPIDAARIVDGLLLNPMGDNSNRVVSAGSLAHSILLSRTMALGPNRMPPLGTSVIDQQAVDLISTWITQDLPAYETFEGWQTRNFGSTNAPTALENADADGDGASNYLEYLTHTDPMNPADLWHITISAALPEINVSYPQLANRGFVVEAASSLSPPNWQALDRPENAPIFSAISTNRTQIDTNNGDTRFYRVRVISP